MWEGQERTIRETSLVLTKEVEETGLSSEVSVNTKEDEAFEKDVLSPSLIRLSLNKKCESMFENIFGLLTEEEGGDGYPCFTLLIQYGAEKH